MVESDEIKEGSLSDAEKEMIEKLINVIDDRFEDEIMTTWQLSNALLRMADMVQNKLLKKRLRLIARVLVERLVKNISKSLSEERKREERRLIDEAKKIEEEKKLEKEQKDNDVISEVAGVDIYHLKRTNKRNISTNARKSQKRSSEKSRIAFV